ncbi:MAG TPA: protein kinase [Polyangia bacterium]|nr:protein kinase [Polyangia bacterium]
MGNAKYEMPPRETEALTFGRYELTRKLSQGGMAEIFLARQSGIGNFEKQVVVKIVLPQLAEDADYEDMLRDEARMAARLNHPNIVQILDLGKLDGRFFIAMEYLEGQNLHSIAQRAFQAKKQLPIGFVCRVVADILSGLEHAHAQADENGQSLGIIHRDVSPPNVIVTWAGTTKIVDFGIAKATRAVDGNVTNAGQFKGKLGYMSPEQVRRQPLDARTDIFSTGVILWELITGKRLFRRAGDVETVRAVLEQDVLPPSVHNNQCPPELDAIVLRALQRPTQARYATARAMRKAVEELIREQAWPSDSLTTQRVLGGLFREEQASRPIRLRPVPVVVSGEPLSDDNETTRRNLRVDQTEPDPVVIELTAPFELAPAQEPVLLTKPVSSSSSRLTAMKPRPPALFRRRFPIALGIAIGLAGCALVTSVGRHGDSSSLSGSSSLSASTGATATGAVTMAATTVAPIGGATAGATEPREVARELAVPSVAEPAGATKPVRAKVQVRVDAKAIVKLDGATIEADRPVEVDVDGHHTITVQRVGHRAVRTIELPTLEPGQLMVVGLYLRGQPDAPRSDDATTTTTTTAAATDEPRAEAAPEPVAGAVETAAATAGSVVR